MRMFIPQLQNKGQHIATRNALTNKTGGARFSRAPYVVSVIAVASVVSVSVVCDQVDQVVPAHRVDDIDEAHQVDPVHQVDHQDEFTCPMMTTL